MSLTSIIATLLLFFTTSASAAVLGIDFGTQHLKAVLVTPGRPFDIVLTKDSKRKEVAAVAFKPTRDGNKILAEAGSFPERLYGGDAIALQGRFPGEIFPNLKPLLGLAGTEEDQLKLSVYHLRYPSVQLSDPMQPSIKSSAFHQSELPWTVEELLAMELANIKRNAESAAGKGVPCNDVVITIPAFYNAQEKAAISRAAELAGFNVMALVTDGLAVGLDYAKSRTFPSVSKGGKPEHHLVYDMGAGSTTATLLRFQGRDVKDVGRYNKTIQEVAVIGAGWDEHLGGDALTQIVLTDYMQKFLTKPVIKSRGIRFEELQENGRALSRLWKEAEKARSVLSANTETSSSFEELLPDIDFKTKLTRTEFEGLIENYADRVTKPIEDALAAAGLTIKDVDSIILHGGAVRTPFVQRKLEQFAGGSAKLKSNVNADESAVQGAALKAAMLSPSFKVKEIRTTDATGYASGFTFTDGNKPRSQIVFNPTSAVGNNGTAKQITLKQKDDFTFQLYQKFDDVETSFAQVTTKNLTASVKALKDRFSCDKDDVSTKFSLRLNPESGVIEAVLGTVSCETDQAIKSSVGDSVKDWLGLGKKKDSAASDDDEAEPTEEVPAAESTSRTSADASASKVPEAPKKRTETINIDFITTFINRPSSEETQRRVARLAAFDRSDKSRLARDEAANVLESYTYYVKDFLTNTDYSSYSTDAQRSAISKLLQTTRDFMDQPGEVTKATEKVFREKLNDLKALVTPVITRRSENEGRADKLSALQTGLEQTESFIKMVTEQISKAKDAASSSIAKAAESATAIKDDLDDLEEPDTPESTKDDDLPSFESNYTEQELETIQDVYDKVKTWLTGKEAEQKQVQLFEDPAYTMKQLEEQAALLSDATMKLIAKRINIPRSSKKAKTSKTKATKKSKSTSAAENSAPDAPADEDILNKAKFMTVRDGQEMPSEEEILRMVRDAKNQGSESASSSKRDEL